MVVVTSVSEGHTVFIVRYDVEGGIHLKVHAASQLGRSKLRDSSEGIKCERKVMWYCSQHINEFWFCFD